MARPELCATRRGEVRAFTARETTAGAGQARAFTERERAVGKIWSELLAAQLRSPTDDFFALGGDSLLAVEMVERVRAALGVTSSLEWLLEDGRLASFAARCGARVEPDVPRAQPGARSPASPGQQQLWAQLFGARDTALYNEVATITLRGAVDVAALRGGLRHVTRCHDALRLRLRWPQGALELELADSDEVLLRHIDLIGLDPEDQELEATELVTAETRRPLDLGAGPLWRVLLVSLADDHHLLYLVFSHLVIDGGSMRRLLVPQLAAAYGALSRGEQPEAAPGESYLEFAAQMSARASRAAHAANTAPAGPTEVDIRGAHLRTRIDASAHTGVLATARALGVTPFAVYLSALRIALTDVLGAEGWTLAVPVDLRPLANARRLVGYGLTTVALDLPRAASTESEHLRASHRASLATLSWALHQPAGACALARSRGVAVGLSYEASAPALPPGWTLDPHDLDTGTSATTLGFSLVETDSGVSVRVEYATAQLSAQVVAGVAERFISAVDRLIRLSDELSAP